MLKLISIHIPRAIFRSIKSTYTTMFRNLDSSSVQNEKSSWLEDSEHGHDPFKYSIREERDAKFWRNRKWKTEDTL